ncbi:MAG: hypothetical protein LBB81_06050 [Treponema sp.]|jgi:hypothetical protein|nr:hypothetical protein [Treponema sp.]
MKKILFIVTVIFPVYLAAQVPNYYTNSVTRLNAEVRNNFIRLTWADSPDAKGTVYIFRSARQFTGIIPANIRPVPVRYGTQYYIDDIDDMENVHYFIAASDLSGKIFDTIIPGVNSLGIYTGAVQEYETPVQDQAQITIPAVVRGITELNAVRENDRIIITFNINSPVKNVVLYRSMRPVTNIRDLINAIVVQTGVSSPYIDFPVPGINWYYTALFEDEISNGNITLRSGHNSTSQAVIISSTEPAQITLRPVPLPFLSINNNIFGSGGFAEITDTVPLKKDTEDAIESVETAPKEPFVRKTPRIFKVDLDSPSDGQEGLLNKIVHDFFIKLDWENSRNALVEFLLLPRSKELQNRARFYLGQSFYFTEQYREALFEFLSLQPVYSNEASAWIESVLAAIVY